MCFVIGLEYEWHLGGSGAGGALDEFDAKQFVRQQLDKAV